MIVPSLMRLVAAPRISLKDRVHFCAGVLKQSALGVENHHCNFAFAKYAELHGLLHQPILPFRERDLQQLSVSASDPAAVDNLQGVPHST